jgi:hypothetical protein
MGSIILLKIFYDAEQLFGAIPFSAFSPTEIEVVKNWVKDGGSLLLIADHMPFAGAVADLAKAFGFIFFNGFAIKKGEELCNRSKGNLQLTEITNGRLPGESI